MNDFWLRPAILCAVLLNPACRWVYKDLDSGDDGDTDTQADTDTDVDTDVTTDTGADTDSNMDTDTDTDDSDTGDTITGIGCSGGTGGKGDTDSDSDSDSAIVTNDTSIWFIDTDTGHTDEGTDSDTDGDSDSDVHTGLPVDTAETDTSSGTLDTGVACLNPVPFTVVAHGTVESQDSADTALLYWSQNSCNRLRVWVATNQTDLAALFDKKLPGVVPPIVDFSTYTAVISRTGLCESIDFELSVHSACRNGDTISFAEVMKEPYIISLAIGAPYNVVVVPDVSGFSAEATLSRIQCEDTGC